MRPRRDRTELPPIRSVTHLAQPPIPLVLLDLSVGAVLGRQHRLEIRIAIVLNGWLIEVGSIDRGGLRNERISHGIPGLLRSPDRLVGFRHTQMYPFGGDPATLCLFKAWGPISPTALHMPSQEILAER